MPPSIEGATRAPADLRLIPAEALDRRARNTERLRKSQHGGGLSPSETLVSDSSSAPEWLTLAPSLFNDESARLRLCSHLGLVSRPSAATAASHRTPWPTVPSPSSRMPSRSQGSPGSASSLRVLSQARCSCQHGRVRVPSAAFPSSPPLDVSHGHAVSLASTLKCHLFDTALTPLLRASRKRVSSS